MRITHRPARPADAALLTDMYARRAAEPALEATIGFVHGGMSATTIRQYAVNFAVYARWARALGEDPYGGELVVARFFDEPLDLAERTLTNYRSAIAAAYTDRGLPDPTRGELVSRRIDAVRRALGVRVPTTRPIVAAEYLALCAAQDEKRAGLRNRVLFGLGFEAALNSGEAIALDVSDVAVHERGVVLRITTGRARRDVVVSRRGAGDFVSAIEQWVAETGIVTGPLLRNLDRYGGLGAELGPVGASMAVKTHCSRVLGIAEVEVSMKSLRTGHIVEAMRHGVPRLVLAKYLGFNRPSLLEPYVRVAERYALTEPLEPRHV